MPTLGPIPTGTDSSASRKTKRPDAGEPGVEPPQKKRKTKLTEEERKQKDAERERLKQEQERAREEKKKRAEEERERIRQQREAEKEAKKREKEAAREKARLEKEKEKEEKKKQREEEREKKLQEKEAVRCLLYSISDQLRKQLKRRGCKKRKKSRVQYLILFGHRHVRTRTISTLIYSSKSVQMCSSKFH